MGLIWDSAGMTTWYVEETLNPRQDGWETPKTSVGTADCRVLGVPRNGQHRWKELGRRMGIWAAFYSQKNQSYLWQREGGSGPKLERARPVDGISSRTFPSHVLALLVPLFPWLGKAREMGRREWRGLLAGRPDARNQYARWLVVLVMIDVEEAETRGCDGHMHHGGRWGLGWAGLG